MIQDSAGNALTAIHFVPEPDAADTVMSLVVVTYRSEVLLVHDRWRNQWELPGGGRDPGETPRQTAERELTEETGIAEVPLTFEAVADFTLATPPSKEQGAIYSTTLTTEPSLKINEEVSAFRWWHPDTPLTPDQSPIDAELARQIHNHP